MIQVSLKKVIKIKFMCCTEFCNIDGIAVDVRQVAALGQLKNTFGMGKREAEAVMQEVTVKIYRRMLAKAVQNGDLEAAPSKAMFLQNLCDTLQFDPAKAGEVHEGANFCQLSEPVSATYIYKSC